MRVLVIGAGAIGQVFGHSFARGGAAVTFLARPRQVEALRAEPALYPMNRPASERTRPVRLRDVQVVDDPEVAVDGSWDVVVLAVTSLSLRDAWFDRLCEELGNGHLLSLLPGSDDPAYVLQRAPADRVSFGLLSLMSFQAPLPGQSLPEEGVAFWFPGGASLAFSGPDPMTTRLIEALRAGGMPTRRSPDVPAEVAFTGPILAHTVSALECAGWSSRTLRRDRELLPLAVSAMGESWALATARHGAATPWHLRLLSPLHLRLLLRVAPRLAPFDLEAFLAFHYRKVADQHRSHLRKQVSACQAHGIEAPALAGLLCRLEQGGP